ncbi:class I tRNA ligase family protein [Streptomyces sp. AA4]|uniref:class I tRNA ligase family protein n=1 Tax=Actinomycetes TaxID=1760 RepID=UPI002571024E|nr:class I tRNA ligase family protein [Streptomyces sp. AA4]
MAASSSTRTTTLSGTRSPVRGRHRTELVIPNFSLRQRNPGPVGSRPPPDRTRRPPPRGAGFRALLSDLTANASRWTNAAERVHVLGKGILRFHAVYWPALLLSAGERLPDTIFVHDYLTVYGAKISKSAGNTVRPTDLIDQYGADAVRWWLLREVAPLGDTDFTEDRLIARADDELANGLGNLVHRVLSLARRTGRIVPAGPLRTVHSLADRIDAALADFDFRSATGALVQVIADANRYVEQTRPWALRGDELDQALGTVVSTCRELATELSPFLPDRAARLHAQLDRGEPARLYPRLRQQPRH